MLEGVAPAGLAEATIALIEARKLRVVLAGSAAELGGANGVTDWSVGLVRADMDEAARCKTLLHEAAHVLLHGYELWVTPARRPCSTWDKPTRSWSLSATWPPSRCPKHSGS